MGKIFQKKSDIQNDTITIEDEPIDALFLSARWCADGKKITSSDASGASVVAQLCEQPEISKQSIDIKSLTRITSDDIIDRFLLKDTHRIVAEEGEVTQEIVIEAEFDDDEDMVSEELAEIYLAQGLKDMAKETYRKLSLLNPEKSIYFAGIIQKIDSNN
jgi:hypothetical protein